MACDDSNCENDHLNDEKSDRHDSRREQKDNESRCLSVLAMVIFEFTHLLFAAAMLWSDNTPLVDNDDPDLETLNRSVNCGIFGLLALIATLVATACAMQRKDQRPCELHGLVASPFLLSLLFSVWTMLGPGARIFPMSASAFFFPLFLWLRAGFWLEAWLGTGSFLLGKVHYELLGVRGGTILAACL